MSNQLVMHQEFKRKLQLWWGPSFLLNNRQYELLSSHASLSGAPSKQRCRWLLILYRKALLYWLPQFAAARFPKFRFPIFLKKKLENRECRGKTQFYYKNVRILNDIQYNWKEILLRVKREFRKTARYKSTNQKDDRKFK